MTSAPSLYHELKSLRSDCSCGPDDIPVKFVKLVADCLASPLTHIVNTCISQKAFPSAWKTARISPIPKQAVISDNNEFRPISILPVLSKVYERLVLGQMAKFLSNGPDCVLKDNVSAYRKGHITTTAMLAIKDDIIRATKSGEVTLAVLADFSKAFDTVAYEIVLTKLHGLGFSKSFLTFLTSYLTERKQFVQIDDKASSTVDLKFGVPQGSVSDPYCLTCISMTCLITSTQQTLTSMQMIPPSMCLPDRQISPPANPVCKEPLISYHHGQRVVTSP